MKFALFGNTYQAKKSAHVERLLSILSQHNAEVHICREFYEFLTDDLKISIRHAGVFDGNNFEADMILSIGGDGTSESRQPCGFTQHSHTRYQHRTIRFSG